MTHNPIFLWKNHYGQPRRRKDEDLPYEELKELFMLTVARLDAALADKVAKDGEITDLKGQVATLKDEVAKALPADVIAKAEALVDAHIGPEVAPAP